MIVDFHTHLLPPSFMANRAETAAKDRTFAALFPEDGIKTASASDLLAAMDAGGIDVSVALGYGWTSPDVARQSNDYLLDAAASSNGCIVAFCSVNPSWGEAALREVERCLDAGAKGVGELHPASQGVDLATDERLADLMLLAAARDVPVVVHGSEPVGHTYAGKGDTHPQQLLALAERFPEARIVAAHWGGGLPFYSHMPEVRKALANVWFDSAVSPFLYDANVYATVASAVGVDRMLFGSDYPLLSAKRVADEARAVLHEADAARFLGDNVVELLGL